MSALSGVQFPSAPAGHHFEVTPAGYFDVESLLESLTWGKRKVTVWLRRDGDSHLSGTAAFARANQRSIARAARRVLRRHFRRQVQSAKWVAEDKARIEKLSGWTGVAR